jgi:hypothetical protein
VPESSGPTPDPTSGPTAASVFDPAEIVRVLVAHGVDFVIIGGAAAALHGSPFPTQDVDITPRETTDNLKRLSAALTDLGARIRTDAVPEGLAFSHDAESLAAGSVWNLTTDHGDLDLAMHPSGTGGYDDLVRDAVVVVVDGVESSVASLGDVIRSKEAANRDKDRRVLPELRRILADQDKFGD